MSINANRLVSITPRVISGGSADLETNGLILTANTSIQGNVPAIEFNTVKEVGEFFGLSSAEYLAAEQYFTGVNNQSKAITTLWFGRILTTAGSGWLRAGKTVTLETLKAITDGAFGIKVDGNTNTLTGLNFSSATSFGDVATAITTGLTGAVCSYDSVQKKFVITSATTGETSIIEFGTAPASGTNLTALLGLDASGGAVQSLGNDALTVAENMDAITVVTRNFVGFTTLVKASDSDAVSYAAWADLDDDYVYFYWSDDTTLLSKSTNQASVPVTLQAYNTTACLYGSIYDAVFMLAVGASMPKPLILSVHLISVSSLPVTQTLSCLTAVTSQVVTTALSMCFMVLSGYVQDYSADSWTALTVRVEFRTILKVIISFHATWPTLSMKLLTMA